MLSGDALEALAPRSDPDRLRIHRELHTQASMALPLRARGQVFGAVALGLGSRVYSESEVALAQGLASRTAVAMDNARLVRELQVADKRKDNFLAMLGHELRNPLAAISNADAVLGLVEPESEMAENMRALISRQIVHLTRLVDDLLDVARVTHGRIELRKERVALRDVVRRAVEATHLAAAARDHRLLASSPAETLWLEADATRLEQILVNLLQNAIKYTDPGGTITLTAVREDGEIVLSVRDTGAGIPADTLPHVFDLFTQAERSLARTQGGLGIGLTLVKALVEMHGGRVEARSEGDGRGSEFIVRLAAADSGPSSADGGSPAGEARSRADSVIPLRVLIVEDSADVSEALARLLGLWHHDVQVVADGHAGIAAARMRRPDVVLLDIGLPEMDGYAVAAAMRREGLAQGVTFVALTGYGQQEDVRRSTEAGFEHHLVKPIDATQLRTLLADVSADRAARERTSDPSGRAL